MPTSDHLSGRIVYNKIDNLTGRQCLFHQLYGGTIQSLLYGVMIELLGEIALPRKENIYGSGLIRHDPCSHTTKRAIYSSTSFPHPSTL